MFSLPRIPSSYLFLMHTRWCPLSLFSFVLYSSSTSGRIVSHREAFHRFTSSYIKHNTSKRFLPSTATRLYATSTALKMSIWEDNKLDALQRCIIPLSEDSYKGASGRIGIIGGNAQYTGAPYYAAMACLKAGADLAYVFTAKEATLPIKSYSPELMVTGCYDASAFDALVESNPHLLQNAEGESSSLIDDMVKKVTDMMEKMHSLVIGPGMGRCPAVMLAVSKIIEQAKKRNLPIVLDADALYMLSLEPYRNILKGYPYAVLTPNRVEYDRLFEKGDPDSFEGLTIVMKGREDVIVQNGVEALVCTEQGGLKRSGGIGDILCGTMGTLVAWNALLKKRGFASTEDLPLACWTACCFVKRATKRAFDNHKRAMTAPDVLDALGPTIDEMTSLESFPKYDV